MKPTRRACVTGLLAAPALVPFIGSAGGAEQPPFRFIGAAPVHTPALSYFYLSKPLRLRDAFGIATDFHTVAGSSLSTQLVASGHGDLTTISPLDLLIMKTRQPELPVRAVYKLDVLNGNNIGIPTDSPLKTIADLKGKAIGVQGLASVTVAHAKALLRAAGVNPAEVALLPVGIGAPAVTALRLQQVQALCLQRSQFGALENLGLQFQYFWAPGSSSLMVTNESTLQNRRADLVRALRVVTASIIFSELNQEATVHYYWQVAGQPAGDVDKALRDAMHVLQRNIELWKPIADPRPWGAFDVADWTTALDFLGLDSSVNIKSADPAKLYTNDLVADVNAADFSAVVKAAGEWKRPG
jgi:NitT/TauT family transport system substrate-binding protein